MAELPIPQERIVLTHFIRDPDGHLIEVGQTI
jgi:hypothetical protein